MVQFKNVFTGMEKRPYDGRPRRRSASAPAASTTTSKTWATRAPPHVLRDAGQLLVRRLLQGPGDRAGPGRSSPRNSAFSPERLLVTVYADDDEAATLWKKIAGFLTTRSSASAPRTISGRWATPAPAVRAPRSSSIRARLSRAAPPAARTRTATASSNSGTSCSCSTSSWSRGCATPCRALDRHGMGLERMAAILQGVPSNYETDLFKALIEAVAHAVSRAPEPATLASYRVIADHLRASAFLVADGVLPGKRGPRLRPAPDHAPGDASTPRSSSCPRADHVPPRADAGAGDGPGLSRADAGGGPDRRDPEAGGVPLPPHPGAGPVESSIPKPATFRPARTSRARPPSPSTTPTAFPSI